MTGPDSDPGDRAEEARAAEGRPDDERTNEERADGEGNVDGAGGADNAGNVADAGGEGNVDDANDANDAGAADPAYAPETRAVGHPIDANALMIAAAKASVGAGQLPELLRRADEYLRERADEYDRSYERVDEAGDGRVYLVPEDHWSTVGEALDLHRREADALRRAHEQHLLRVGTKQRRRQEFETALELRDAVVVAP